MKNGTGGRNHGIDETIADTSSHYRKLALLIKYVE